MRFLFECMFFAVIPASEARRESFWKDSGQANCRPDGATGMTEIWICRLLNTFHYSLFTNHFLKEVTHVCVRLDDKKSFFCFS